jgi:hypothetical protein
VARVLLPALAREEDATEAGEGRVPPAVVEGVVAQVTHLPQDDRLDAAIMLVGNTGARALEVGYLEPRLAIQRAAWWAHATYQGRRIGVEKHAGPAEAVEALAKLLLTGGRCMWCKGLTTLDREGVHAVPGGEMADGSRQPETVEELQALGLCLWQRRGKRWEPGCLHGESTAPGAPKTAEERAALTARYEATRGRQNVE